jgi:hypothetical protein
MGLPGADGYLFHFKPDPEEVFDHESFAVQQEQRVHTAISLHVITG